MIVFFCQFSIKKNSGVHSRKHYIQKELAGSQVMIVNSTGAVPFPECVKIIEKYLLIEKYPLIIEKYPLF